MQSRKRGLWQLWFSAGVRVQRAREWGSEQSTRELRAAWLPPQHRGAEQGGAGLLDEIVQEDGRAEGGREGDDNGEVDSEPSRRRRAQDHVTKVLVHEIERIRD